MPPPSKHTSPLVGSNVIKHNSADSLRSKVPFNQAGGWGRKRRWGRKWFGAASWRAWRPELQVASSPSVQRSDRVPPFSIPLPCPPRLVVTTRHYDGGSGGNLQLRASSHRRRMLMVPQMGSDCELSNHALFIGFTTLKTKQNIFFFDHLGINPHTLQTSFSLLL